MDNIDINKEYFSIGVAITQLTKPQTTSKLWIVQVTSERGYELCLMVMFVEIHYLKKVNVKNQNSIIQKKKKVLITQY